MRLAKAGELLRSEVFQIEQRADLPSRAFGDDERTRAGKRLQPRGKIRRLADDPALLCGTLADQITDHGEPGSDAEPHAQIFSRRQSADRLDHRQPGPHRPLGIVLMRPRIAEIDQHTIAHVFGDKAVEAADRFGDRAVIGADQLPQILRVMTGRERGRADEIAEHDRQLPPFRLGPHPSLPRDPRGKPGEGRVRVGAAAIARDGWNWGRQRFGRAECGDGVEQFATMADRGDTQLAQILAREPA